MTKNYWKMQELLQNSTNITKQGNLLSRKKSRKVQKLMQTNTNASLYY